MSVPFEEIFLCWELQAAIDSYRWPQTSGKYLLYKLPEQER